jgi:hypothetical protein
METTSGPALDMFISKVSSALTIEAPFGIAAPAGLKAINARRIEFELWFVRPAKILDPAPLLRALAGEESSKSVLSRTGISVLVIANAWALANASTRQTELIFMVTFTN